MVERERPAWDTVWRLGVDEDDSGKRLEHFKRSLEVAREEGSIQGSAASEAAIRMMQVANQGGGNFAFTGSGMLRMVREPSVLRSFAGPAFCTSLHDFRDAVGHQDWEVVWQPMLPYGLWGPGLRIPLPPALNESLEERSDNDRILTVSSVVSLTERAEVDAGVFENCLKVETVITHDENNQHLAGTLWSWFTPSVGLVKEQYFHSDGDETLTQLVSFSISDEPSSRSPLDVGNRWEYRGTKCSNPVVAKHVFWVEAGIQDAQSEVYTWFIPYYSYATLED